MAISSHALLLSHIRAPNERVYMVKGNSGALTAATWVSIVFNSGNPQPFAIPTTSVALDRTVVGTFGQRNGGSAALRMLYADWFPGGNTSGGQQLTSAILYDRLVHSGGLSGTSTSAQTTNLPTAALPRYTSGIGVQIALEILLAVGSTGTTASVSYTNQSNTAGRVSDGIPFGTATNGSAVRWLPVPLQAGDTGVKSVESVTLAASTGTVGNFGVVLYKPLVPLAHTLLDGVSTFSPFHTLGGFLPEILDDSALCLVVSSTQAVPGPFTGVFRFSED